ncbi:MAG: SDR family NAD(P)-dependent oxidoreductase, partial [Caulobacteraceae bacterium]
MALALIARGAAINQPNRSGNTPLLAAVYGGHTATVKALLRQGATVWLPSATGQTALNAAAHCGHTDTALALIQGGAPVDQVGYNGLTPLMAAAAMGHETTVAELLRQGADVHRAATEGTHPGDTALNCAALGGHAGIATALIRAGARVDEAGCHGFTPLMLAAKIGSQETVSALLDAGATAGLASMHPATLGVTALSIAARRGNTGAAIALIERPAGGALIDQAGWNGYTPLMEAAEGGQPHTIEALLTRGAAPDRARTGTRDGGMTALTRAAEERYGRVDLFCSNAGIATRDEDMNNVASSSNDLWQRDWGVNVMAHVYAARAALPGMIARGEGWFLNTVSAAGLLSQVGSAIYSTTKHAAVGFAESLAITHRHDGIGVSILCPQAVDTPMLGGARGSQSVDGVLSPEQVAGAAIEGLAAESFLI